MSQILRGESCHETGGARRKARLRTRRRRRVSKSPAWPESRRRQPGELTFLVNRKYRPALDTTRASAILVARDAGPMRIAALRSANPYLDFARAIELFHPAPEYPPGIHPTAVIAKSAEIGSGAHIGPYCYVDEDVRNREKRGAAQLRLDLSRREDRRRFFRPCACHAFAKHARSATACCCRTESWSEAMASASPAKPMASWYKMRQSGITVIGDDVEIQAQAAIDRATVGETHIGRGTKIDNLVQVGHACKVGEDTLLCGQVGLAGTTERGQSLHPGGTGRRGGPLDNRRRRDRHRPERSSHRRSCRGHLLRVSCDGQSRVAKIGRRFQPAAGIATRTPRVARRKSRA